MSRIGQQIYQGLFEKRTGLGKTRNEGPSQGDLLERSSDGS